MPQVQIWYGSVDAGNRNYQHDWATLDANEQAQAAKFKTDLLRGRYVAAHGRLRRLLAGLINDTPGKLVIKRDEYGKPYLADYPELAFNLSHSADDMAIAVGWNCRIGIDIERCKARTSLARLAAKCFAEEEIGYWNALPDSEKRLEFYRYWTRKEAFVKATGRGIVLGLNQCVVDPDNPAGFLRVPSECGLPSMWHIFDRDLGQGVCAALVTDQAMAELSWLENW